MTEPLIDYLRLSTFEDTEYYKLAATIRRLDGEFKISKWLQYSGWRGAFTFYGVAEQHKTRHYIAHASGAASPDFYHDILNNNIDLDKTWCTRLDLQKTVDYPKDFSFEEIYNESKVDNGRYYSAIFSSTGNTFYFGNRTSDLFTRLYEKEIDATRFLRLEFEIKGDLARVAFNMLAKGDVSQLEAYEKLLCRAKIPKAIENIFTGNLLTNKKFTKLEEFKELNDKYKWLANLGPTIIKMGNDHALGYRVINLLESWLKQIDTSN